MSSFNDTVAPPRQGFLNSLRTRTAVAHQLLEQHPVSSRITRPDIKRSGYLGYLQVMQRVVDEMERQLEPMLENELPDFGARKKATLLQSDLYDLQADDNVFPAFRFSIPDESVAYAWGAFYVLEGSSLGGRVILKSLPAALDVTEQRGARYFAGYGKSTGPMWQQFLKGLEAFAQKTDEPSLIVKGAEDTFTLILQHFDRCVAYEAEGHS